MTVGKFQTVVNRPREHPYEGSEVRLEAIYDESLPEDQRYAKATPSGGVGMAVTNPAALETFKEGEPVYTVFMTEDEYRQFEGNRS